MTTPEPKANSAIYLRLASDVREAIRALSRETGIAQVGIVEMLLRKALTGGVHNVETPEQRMARAMRGDKS